MNTDGFSPWSITRFGGQVDWDQKTQLPKGLANLCRNSRFLAESVATRYGLRQGMTDASGPPGDFTGFECLKVLGVPGVTELTVVYGDLGFLLVESPAGSGTLVPLGLPNTGFPSGPSILAIGALMQTAKAFNRVYAAFSDGQTGLGPALVIDGATQLVSVLTPNPVGGLWKMGTVYQVGDTVRTSTGAWFRCTQQGVASAIEPTWPTTYGHLVRLGPALTWVAATAADANAPVGQISLWEEWTPIVTAELPPPPLPVAVVNRQGVGGSIGATLDVYMKFSYTTVLGETTIVPFGIDGKVATNTTGGVNSFEPQFQLSGFLGGPNMPAWMSYLIRQPLYFNGFKLRIYVATVSTGAGAPVAGSYNWQEFDPAIQPKVLTAAGTPAVVSTKPAAISLALETAHPVFIGEAGVRQMVITHRDTNGTKSPIDPGSVIAAKFKTTGTAPFAFIPPGGPSSALDIAGFTVVGESAGGPFNWIETAFPENPFQATVGSISRVANSCTAVLSSVAGLAVGEIIFIATPPSGSHPSFDTSLSGSVTLATVDPDTNTVTYPQIGPNASYDGLVPLAATVYATLQRELPTAIATGTVGIPLDFDDNFLSNNASLEITYLLTALTLPALVDIQFIACQNKMVYLSDLYPTQSIWSRTNDVGEIDGDSAFLPVEPNNGGRLITIREVRSGEIVAVKSKGGYTILPNDSPPSEWGVRRLWGGGQDDHGPPSSNLVGVGTGFMVFADEQGVWKYPSADGDVLDCISEEFLDTWKRINWKKAHQGWMTIDEKEKVVRFGLPLDDATTPSHELAVSYLKGWAVPITVDTRSGKTVLNLTARRWSINDIAARCSKIIDHDLGTPIDNRVDRRQRFYGRTNSLDFEVPDVYNDKGAPIDWHYTPTYARGGPSMPELRFGGFSGRFRGEGTVLVGPETDDPDVGLTPIELQMKGAAKATDVVEEVLIDAQRLALHISNGNVKDAWGEIQELCIYYRVTDSTAVAR